MKLYKLILLTAQLAVYCICLLPLNVFSQNFNSANLGLKFYSLTENHGVILYNDYQLIPFIAVFLLDNRLEFLTSSLSYRDYIYSDVIRLRTKLQYVQDEPVLPKHKSIQDIYPNRENSYEWQNRLEIFIPGNNENYLAELDLGWTKDLKAYFGNYFEALLKVKLADLKILAQDKYTLEPNIFLSLGYGDKSHNLYYYGPNLTTHSAEAGFNNFAYGFWVNVPQFTDRNNSFITFKHFEVLKEQNKNGLFAQNRDSGWALSLTYSLDIL